MSFGGWFWGFFFLLIFQQRPTKIAKKFDFTLEEERIFNWIANIYVTSVGIVDLVLISVNDLLPSD
jgi:hypothetical protein